MSTDLDKCPHCGTEGILIMGDGACPNCKKLVHPICEPEDMHKTKRSVVGKTLVSLWHTWIRYDWRALFVTNDAIYLIYLGKPNPLLVLLGPIGGIIMQAQARNAYKRTTEFSIEQKANSHVKNMTLFKGEVTNIQGSSRKMLITTNQGKTFKLIRMGDGDLMAMMVASAFVGGAIGNLIGDAIDHNTSKPEPGGKNIEPFSANIKSSDKVLCKGCGKPLRQIQIDTIDDPNCNDWWREGFCSYSCHEDKK